MFCNYFWQNTVAKMDTFASDKCHFLRHFFNDHSLLPFAVIAPVLSVFLPHSPLLLPPPLRLLSSRMSFRLRGNWWQKQAWDIRRHLRCRHRHRHRHRPAGCQTFRGWTADVSIAHADVRGARRRSWRGLAGAAAAVAVAAAVVDGRGIRL